MVITGREDYRKQTEIFYKNVKNSLITSVKYDDFIRHALKTKYPEPQQAEIIRIAPPLEEIVKGNLKPQLEFEFKPSFIDGDIPSWCGKTTDGIDFLGIGYKRGDKSQMFSDGLGEKYPHGVMAGSSGSGKTVTLNSKIITAAIEYPPWELNLKLVDAKITEFLNYADNGILPHVSVIGATGDADYIISALAEAVKEMEDRLVAFGAIGVPNIQEFRAKTGLVLPRVLMIIDEVGALFMKAQKKLKQIQTMFDILAAQGRSAGVHILLCSQQITSDFPNSVLNNMLYRGCLGAYKAVSERIINNEAAAEFTGQKGKLIINTNIEAGDPESTNQLFYTPFLAAEPPKGSKGLHDYKRILEEMGERILPRKLNNLIFFNENLVLTKSTFKRTIEQLSCSRTQFYLGEPAYVQYWNPIPLVPIRLEANKAQNIIIYSANRDKNLNLLSMLLENIRNMKAKGENVAAIYYSIDNVRTNAVMKEYEDVFTCTYSISSADSELEAALRKAYIRKLCQEVDKRIFSGEAASIDNVPINIQDIFFEQMNSKTELDISRCAILFSIIPNSAVGMYVGAAIEKGNANSEFMNLVYFCALEYTKLPDRTKKFNYKDLATVYHVVDFLQELKGIGVPPFNSKVKTKIASLMREASEYGHYVIVTVTNMNEFATDFRESFEYWITYQLESTKVSRTGFGDYYPEHVSDKLGVLCVSQESIVERKTLKFKLYKED